MTIRQGYKVSFLVFNKVMSVWERFLVTLLVGVISRTASSVVSLPVSHVLDSGMAEGVIQEDRRTSREAQYPVTWLLAVLIIHYVNYSSFVL
jgi:hypothetical protein